MEIEIRALTKVYAKNRGLSPLNLGVQRGEFVAVVGHNGAGKSTLLKLLASWIVPDSGDAVVDGTHQTDRIALVRKVGFVPETPCLFECFSVDYNLRLYARLFGIPPDCVEKILLEFNLLPFRRNKVQALSKGLKQRVSLGRSLLADPPVLLLDEPTSGLDFEMTKDIYERLRAVHACGKTILFTSHRPEEVKFLASRIIVLHSGRLLFDGSPLEYFRSRAHEDLYT